jgi:hypothetical protein
MIVKMTAATIIKATTIWCVIFLKKCEVAHVAKICPTFYGIGEESTSLEHTPSQLNPVHVLIIYSCMINFNIILPSVPRFTK